MHTFYADTTADAQEVNENFTEVDTRVETLEGKVFQEIARTTLTSSADSITVSDIPERKYLKIIVLGIATGGTLNTALQFNGDTGSNYAWSITNNGSYSATAPSTSLPMDSGSPTGTQLGVYDAVNVSSAEKIVQGKTTSSTTVGAGTASTAIEVDGKWANTSSAIDEILYSNNGSGDFASGSEVIVMGMD